MSEQHDHGNKHQLPGRGIKWQRIEDVPCAEYESQRRHSTRDALFGKRVTKRQDGVTHGKVVFCPVASSYSQSSEQSSIISSPATIEDISFTSPFVSGEVKYSCTSSTPKKTLSDSEDCVVVDSELIPSNTLFKSGANKLVISTTIPKHMSSAYLSLKTLVQVMLEYNGHKRGLDTMWKHMGVETNMGHCLYPEEALFLMQASDFRALCPNNRVLSVEHALAFTNTQYAMFRVYSKLCGAALKPVRHQPHVGITSYEKKIKLDQHNKFKRKKTSVPVLDQISAIRDSTSPSKSIESSEPPCNANVPNAAQISNVSTVKSIDSKDDIDLEMVAFYSCIEGESEDEKDTLIVNTTEPKDEMEDVVEEPEDFVVTDDMVKDYERSKQLILRDLPSMNPRIGECRINAAASFLPSSLKVLTEDYVVLVEDIYQYSKKTMRASRNWKQNMNNVANSVSRSYPEPTVGAEPIDCNSDSSEILDSDTETSSSSDSESVSSLSDSEDVCYQGWYTDWNNVIYMKRIMAASDNVTYDDVGKRDLDEPDDRSDKCVKHARWGASPPHVALIHDQNLVQHQGRGATPSAEMTSLNQGLTIDRPAAPIDNGNRDTYTTTDASSSSTHDQPVVPDLEVVHTENENIVREDLTLSGTDSSSASSSSSSSSSVSSSGDSEDSSSVGEDTVKREKDSSLDRDEPVGVLGGKNCTVGNTIDQIVDDPDNRVDSNAENESPTKVSWENPVSDFLNILGQSLKSNSFKNTAEESPETKEEPELQAVVNGCHQSVQENDSSTVSSVINLIYAVRKGTDTNECSSNSAKFMKQEVDEDIRDIKQYKHGCRTSPNNTGVLGAGFVRVSSHTSTSFQNLSNSLEKRPVDDIASVMEADNNDDLRMALPERGHSRGSLAVNSRSGRCGSLQVTVSNVMRPSGNGRNLVDSTDAPVRCVHSAPNGELRVSLGCASTSSDSSFNIRKKGNQQSSVVESSELTSDLALLERLGEQYSAPIQQEGEAGNTWKPPSDFGSPSRLYNCGISVPNTSMIDDNYHEIPSSKGGNFRGGISQAGSAGQSNNRGFSSPRGKHRGKLRANSKFCVDSLEKGEFLGPSEATEVKGDSHINPNIETSRGSYSGSQEAPTQVAHSKEIDDGDISFVQGKNCCLFPPSCSGNALSEYQKYDGSRPFTNQNTNHWRGNHNDGSWRPNQIQDIRDVNKDNFGGYQPRANNQSDRTNNWQSSTEGQSFNQYSSRGRGLANGMQQDSWRAPSDCGRGSGLRRGGDGSWNNIGSGFNNRREGDHFPRGRGGDNFPRGRGGDNFPRGRGGDNFPRGRGGDNFPRGRGGDNFHRGRGGDNFSRGRGGDNFSRGGGGDNFPRGRGGDNFPRGRGGDNFPRGRGGDNFPRGRGGDNFHRGRGGDTFLRGRSEDNFPGGRGGDTFPRGRGGDTFPGGRGGNTFPVGRGGDTFPRGRGGDFIPRGRGGDNFPVGKGGDNFLRESGGDSSNVNGGRPNNTSSSNNRGRERGRGNARQQTRQGRWNYWQTFKAQKSMLDESIVHNVSSWHEYKSAVRSKELERLQRRPSIAAVSAGDVKPIITPSERHAPTLDAVLAKVRGECSTSTPSSSSSGGGDLGEWLQQEVAGAAALYTPSHLPQVAFDVYSCKSNYSRSNPSIPEFRVVLSGEENDENFSACRVLALRRHHADSADLALATNAESTGRVRHVAFPAPPSSDGRLRPHALTWSKKLYERR